MPIVLTTPFAAPSYLDEVIADTPLGLYLMDDTDFTQLTDSSGNGEHLTNVVGSGNMSLQQPALVNDGGKSIEWPGSGSGYYSSASYIFPVRPFTVECWYKHTGAEMTIATHQNNSFYYGANVALGNPTDGISIAVGDGGAPGPSSRRSYGRPSIFTLNETYHIALLVYDLSVPDLFINGVEITDGSATGAWDTFTGSGSTMAVGNSGNRYTIGRAWTTTPTQMGVLDVVAHYGYILTSDRIAAHHAAGVI